MMPTYTFFAVDKGNMTLIQFTNGITMLVDCRRSENRPSPLEYLRTKGLKSLDGIECRGRITRDGKTHQFTFRATRNTATLYPGPLARSAGEDNKS